MPAYNAEKTLKDTYAEIPFDMVDDVIVVDDASNDNTYLVAQSIGIKHVIRHQKNLGYGGNQKTCYNQALALGADIVIMLHPDYQYTPKLIPSMAHMIASDLYQVVLGSRILGKGALRGGMPIYKYIFNRILTLSQNIIIGEKLSEYHTGYRAFSRPVLERINYNANSNDFVFDNQMLWYRAFSRPVLERINYNANSNDFVFDNQMLSQIFMAGYPIAELTCPTKYFTEASSINFSRSVKYGLGVLKTSIQHFLHAKKWARFELYQSPKL